MKRILAFVFCLWATFQLHAQTLKSVLTEQLKSTHTKQDWFVPVNVALEGLTSEQAIWKDGSGNHSIGQLANHLLFWNEHQLLKFRGEKGHPYNGDNEETFNAFNKEQWEQTVRRLSSVLSELEKLIQTSDDAFIRKWAETIGNISTHNAYHTGQIVFIRKQQGSWNPEKGVK
ncbi:DinB family protein [Chryseolinea sp. H1M3-3]|uniref:DinB family protein n=1 Tax=Chryseolinea sp. H1M3-3 TaxID=3034144 RepID=UPI0023EAD217|nr:DinB family protein [Chryseolinea sp. H1M3-3]